jgi:hypothetical protein
VRSVKYTLDRFEGDLAVLLERDNETNEKVIPKNVLGSVNEGDILTITYHGEMIYEVEVHKEETLKARQAAKDLLEKLIQHDKNEFK